MSVSLMLKPAIEDIGPASPSSSTSTSGTCFSTSSSSVSSMSTSDACYTSSSSRSCLAKPCRSPAASTTTPSCCWIFINLSFPLAGSRRRRRLPSRTCVERGGAVRSALVIGDLDHVEYDYIITLQASARDLQVVCRCKLSPLTRCLDELIDGSW